MKRRHPFAIWATIIIHVMELCSKQIYLHLAHCFLFGWFRGFVAVFVIVGFLFGCFIVFYCCFGLILVLSYWWGFNNLSKIPVEKKKQGTERHMMTFLTMTLWLSISLNVICQFKHCILTLYLEVHSQFQPIWSTIKLHIVWWWQVLLVHCPIKRTNNFYDLIMPS